MENCQLATQTEDTEINENAASITGYSVTLSPILYEKINRHVLYVKSLCNPKQTKTKWLVEAIQECLEEDEQNPSQVPKECRLNIQVSPEVSQRILKRVFLTKQTHTSYSKKQWILDAILKKMDREEKIIQKKARELNG